jgi:hypothetical protein
MYQTFLNQQMVDLFNPAIESEDRITALRKVYGPEERYHAPVGMAMYESGRLAPEVETAVTDFIAEFEKGDMHSPDYNVHVAQFYRINPSLHPAGAPPEEPILLALFCTLNDHDEVPDDQDDGHQSVRRWCFQ